jgi:hypothetical protein
MAPMVESSSTDHVVMQAPQTPPFPPPRFITPLGPTSLQSTRLPERRDPETYEGMTIAPTSLQQPTLFADARSVELRRDCISQTVCDTVVQINTLRKECLDVIAHSISLPPASSYYSMLQYLQEKRDSPRGHLTTNLVYPGQGPQTWYFSLIKNRFRVLEEREVKTGEEAVLKVKLGLLLASMRYLMACTSEQQLRTWWTVMVMPLEQPSRFQNGFVTFEPMV